MRQNGDSEYTFTQDDFIKRILGGKVKGLSDIQGRGYTGRGPWGKMIRREIALQAEFPVGFPIGEDIVWSLRMLRMLRLCKTVAVAQSIWYGYVLYTSSAISKYYGNREELVKRWFDIVSEENADYFGSHPGVVGQMLATELYCVIHYDLLSEKNKTGMFQ